MTKKLLIAALIMTPLIVVNGVLARAALKAADAIFLRIDDVVDDIESGAVRHL